VRLVSFAGALDRPEIHEFNSAQLAYRQGRGSTRPGAVVSSLRPAATKKLSWLSRMKVDAVACLIWVCGHA